MFIGAKHQGSMFKRITVDPDKLAARCVIRRLEPVAAAQAEYVCEQMR